MTHSGSRRPFATWVVLAAISGAHAQVQTVSEDFSQGHAANDWATFDGACLTAGDGSGTIPACSKLSYYKGQTLVGGSTGTLPDLVGSGALRLTNGFTSGHSSGFQYGFNQAGGIISNFTFSGGSGVQVLFKTVTYRGNSGGNGGGQGVDEADGADGISFFLVDATQGDAPYDMGAFGGSLGYTCSNTNNDPTLRADGTPRQYDGLLHGYMGLGIDEFGNFLNPGDNTASGPGLQAGRIGLRGAGDVSWRALNAKYPQYYPSSLTLGQQSEAVNNTCKTGTLWDYSSSTGSNTKKKQLTTTIPDYNDLNAYQILPASTVIANEDAVTRSDGTPIAYNLKITQDGLLSFSYSYNGGASVNVITDRDITTNGKLPSLLRFGFAGSTGGSTNVHEILCFQANPTKLADTSVGVNQKAAQQIGSGTQAFLAFYFPNGWWGRVTANDLLYDPTSMSIVVNPTANWDASCALTGVTAPAKCDSTGATNVPALAPSSRVMLTWNGTQGVPFEWSKISDGERANIDPGVSISGTPNRLNYLRGDRTNEINSQAQGMYRARVSVLGDIVDSSPSWVGPPNNPYTLIWKDLLYPNNAASENGTATYAQFVATVQTRQNVVYVGSNDGFVHGFRAGSFDASAKFTTTGTPNDGVEVFAYMPGVIAANTIHNQKDGTLDYSSTKYSHVFFVDAPPATDDLFYQGAWHTWLVGGLGPGGSAIYALDVTDPTQFSESKAASLVIGEWTPGNISCSGNTNCGQNLGNTYGTPVIRRLHNGAWGVIFGNGFGSSTADAGIFIMSVNPKDGTKTFYYLSAGGGTPLTNDGIANPAPADFDGDHITDYVYAGDLHGNVWRFDLTSSDPSQWGSPTLVFTDPNGQAITTKVMVASGPVQGLPRVMVDFGTGYKTPLTSTSPATYSSGVHNIYGIWDWNFTVWNSKSTARMASLKTSPGTIGISQLQQQTLTINATVNPNGNLDGTANPVCWADMPTCVSGAQYGWYITPLHALEQVIFNPVIYQDLLLLNTTVPASNDPFSCKNSADTGWTIAVSLATGGSINGLFPKYEALAVGSQTNNSGSPFIVLAGGFTYLVTQTVGGGDPTGAVACPPGSLICSSQMKPPGPSGKRLTWIQRR